MDYYHLYPENEKATVADSLHFMTDRDFEKQLRLARNSDSWIAPFSSIQKYLKEKENARIEIKNYGNILFMNINCPLDPAVYNAPLTVVYSTSAPQVKVTGAENTGCFINRTGYILINAKPGKEIMIELLY